MEIDEHIKNLEEYCEVDNLFEKDGDFKEFCDNHIANIKAVLQELKNTQADLYEANNRIADLLDLDTQKDKLIDEIILYIIRHNYFDTTEFDKNLVPTIENIRKYFEERCKNAKD